MAPIEVHVGPSDLAGFGKAAAGECEEANQGGALASLTGTAGFDLDKHLLELSRFWQSQLLWFHSESVDVPRRIAFARKFPAFQNRPKGPESVVKILLVNLLNQPGRPFAALSFGNLGEFHLVQLGPASGEKPEAVLSVTFGDVRNAVVGLHILFVEQTRIPESGQFAVLRSGGNLLLEKISQPKSGCRKNCGAKALTKNLAVDLHPCEISGRADILQQTDKIASVAQW